MRELDQNEVKIIRELIKNPRQSDNGIARKTKIPVMTVNRKRKKLEEEGLLKYFASFDNSEYGSGLFKAQQLYTIKFKIGITRHDYLEKIEYDKKLRELNIGYISSSYLGEKDGHLALIMVLNAETESKLVDEFNNCIVSWLREKLGEDAIKSVTSVRITELIRIHHNYLPSINMENGIIKKAWLDEWVFVDKIKYAK